MKDKLAGYNIPEGAWPWLWRDVYRGTEYESMNQGEGEMSMNKADTIYDMLLNFVPPEKLNLLSELHDLATPEADRQRRDNERYFDNWWDQEGDTMCTDKGSKYACKVAWLNGGFRRAL